MNNGTRRTWPLHRVLQSVSAHQALFNFTPAHVHQLNNKSVLMRELDEMKRQTREKRKAYWAEQQKISQPSTEGGYRGKGRTEIVDPGANTEAVSTPTTGFLQ